MSHTTQFVIDGVEHVVEHNADWSGDATLRSFKPGQGATSVRLPAQLLRMIGREAALRDVLVAVEGMMEHRTTPSKLDAMKTQLQAVQPAVHEIMSALGISDRNYPAHQLLHAMLDRVYEMGRDAK